MAAINIQNRLKELQAERISASLQGLAANGAYRVELEEEIAEATREYMLAAVTEIATLRAELFGAQVG